MDVHRSDALKPFDKDFTQWAIYWKSIKLHSEMCVCARAWMICSILILILTWRTRASHLLILFPPMNTNQKIVTEKLNPSILRKDGSGWKQIRQIQTGFHRLLGESHDPKNYPYFSLCLIPTAEKTTRKSRSQRSLSPSLKSEPSRGPLNHRPNRSNESVRLNDSVDSPSVRESLNCLILTECCIQLR